MAIVYSSREIMILSHEKYLLDTLPSACKAKVGQLFNVETPFRMDAEAQALASRLENDDYDSCKRRNKKRKKCDTAHPLEEETKHLHKIYSKHFVQGGLKHEYFPGLPSHQQIRLNNLPLREYVKKTISYVDDNFKNRINEDDYLIPQGAKFKICDISQFYTFCDERKFDVILMDPPWENKHVKRAKLAGSGGYQMLDNMDIQKIPVDKFLSEKGIVVIWCSNNIRHREAVSTWLRTWSLKQIAKLYWLKVTKHGELVCDFSSHKNPHEIIIIATNKDNLTWTTSGVPDNLVVMSQPSGIHSHKPPLSDLIDKYFPGLERRVELFARYLQPNWFSLGNEACKLNHKSLYQSCDN
eukprot:TRINITY_DN4964_c0_g1_i9.p1 TRINITY_DN4964_c0_g1~~TRINITY_DN4964_c0_g1_i9.p1  ORF type:complete len:354 (+),score=31.03 TRINITY_DN4964_c0_g1_i9:113-1174(+)